jgi:glycosyltransferase involved in cell wall biosynthesis
MHETTATTPRVSIILPTHNGAAYIRRAIQSVREQTIKEWELIVVNDGSTDATGALVTESVATDARIRSFVFTSNKGIQKALNEGLMQSRAPLIARIDDDDVWADPRKLEKQLQYLAEHPQCVLVGTGLIVQDEQGAELYRFINPLTDAAIRARMLYRNCFSHSTVLFKKDAAMRFNGYSEAAEVLHIEDYDLWLKLGTCGEMGNIPDYAARFTSRAGALSAKNKLTQLVAQSRLTAQYKNSYPGYYASRALSLLRRLGFVLFAALPASVRGLILRCYKQL